MNRCYLYNSPLHFNQNPLYYNKNIGRCNMTAKKSTSWKLAAKIHKKNFPEMHVRKNSPLWKKDK
jgi:hypothetical protein